MVEGGPAMSRKLETGIPRFALSIAEASAALGIGEDLFRESVQPELKVVRLGRRTLVPCSELARWVEDNSEAVLPSRSSNGG